ncbi:hypothetical protein BGAL_0156g00220 [Botrytis galanthina]|uniref:Uncharacterized protein n=1 Tax=Botrytis galanthina TaxID=278940 RepID=A0A4S8RAE6_9HELO|nr:hypothetical protein BGAL_0156g00220 [Botrytis galanthina]
MYAKLTEPKAPEKIVHSEECLADQKRFGIRSWAKSTWWNCCNRDSNLTSKKENCNSAGDSQHGSEDGKFEGEKPFEREFSFETSEGQANTPGVCLLDSGSDIPLVVSRRWIEKAGKEAEISKDFKSPSSYSLSGHAIEFTGIIRNLVFNPKGSSKIYRRDFLVCEQLDIFVDFIIGAKFIIDEWQVLFGGMKRRIAGWFSHKKETPLEQKEAQILRDNQEKEAQEAELRRQDKKDAQRKKEKEARQKQQGANNSSAGQ